jgi:DNA recombination protein RmuC
MVEVGLLLLGLALGALAAWLIQAYRLSARQGRVEERSALLVANLDQTAQQLAGERQKVVELNAALATAQADLANARERMEQYGRELEAMQTRLKSEFENLANRILEEKASKFTAQNQTNLEALLQPVRQQISEFKQRVEQVYVADTADRAALKQQIEGLTRLNEEITEEARNLTLALKGEAKTQGNWGELILESVLARSGLVRGDHYDVQASLPADDGRRLQPDVVIKLPPDSQGGALRHLVIDSKVSLTAYERHCNAEDAADRERALKEHLNSVRGHVLELSRKNYQELSVINSPDFVFLFIPVEPAFSLAVQNDTRLLPDAFERNIILVTPATLLATLRIVASLWKQEKQNRNALEIARQGGALYDQFASFYADLLQVGDRLRQTGESYESALKRLKEGKGNLIKRVEDLRKLGARAQKRLPADLVEEVTADALTDANSGDAPRALSTEPTAAP